MKYTPKASVNCELNKITGEIIINRIGAEESLRTISNIDLGINRSNKEDIERYGYDDSCIIAHYLKRDAQRTIKFDRINELEILNI